MAFLKIKSIKKIDKQTQVYDLSVKGNHNFFIGKSKILTHNCDYLTPQSQAILRASIEEFYQHTRFIFTCNYIDRLIDPLKSRFQTFEIKPLEISQIKKYINNIIDKEQIKVLKENDIDILVKTCYPDIRKTINTLQKCVDINKNFELKESEILDDIFKTQILLMLKNKSKFDDIRNLVINSTIPDYNILYKMLFDNVKEFIPENKQPHAMIFISEYMYRSSFVVDKEINFSACILKLKELQ